MKVKTRRDIEITIIMDELEAKWLKGIMQNPFCGQTIKGKKEIDSKNRKMFWDILEKEGIKLL